MKNFKSLIFAVVFFYVSSFIFAIDLKISVLDKELEFPLEGAKITLESKKSVNVQSDQDGFAVLQIPDNVKNGIIEVSLPGYKTEKIQFKNMQNELVVSLSMVDAIEGEELVVNRAAPETAQEKSGVSTVMTKEDLKTIVSGGLTEDIMGAVSTMPGVGFSGSWSSEPSIRGGYPRDMACVLDGMYMIYPWHWGGNNTVFNPSMVDTVKLSNGIFSARYGRAVSGLMEVTTIKPDFENFHMNATVDTTTANLYMQVPFGKNVGGLLCGGKVTYLDPIFAGFSAAGSSSVDMFKRAPYIRDGYFKAHFNPISELDITINGMFASDGLTLDQKEEDDGFITKTKVDYDIYDVLGGINIKYMPTEKLQLHGIFSYNMMTEDMDVQSKENGLLFYTDDFISQYGSMLTEQQKIEKKYYLPEIKSSYLEQITEHLFQTKLETEIELSEKNYLCAGVEEVYARTDTKEHLEDFRDILIPNSQNHVFKNIKMDLSSRGNETLSSAVFATWSHGNENSFFSSEAGLRAEFFTIWNKKDDFHLNLIPAVCPRASIVLTPWTDVNEEIEKISFSLGAGLFAHLPMEAMMVNKNFGFKDFEAKPNQAIFSVLGTDIKLANNWNFKTEVYYKYYLSRLYSYGVESHETGNTDLFAKDDGKGHVFGIDAMLQKKKGKKWDGYLSYSFLYARYLNPSSVVGIDSIKTHNGDPLDQWYYPSFHRFHTANLVSNWHFENGWTFTLKGTLATGSPKDKIGNSSCYATRLEDGTVVQRYTRSSVYSETLRTQISCPVDVRVSYSWKTNNEKTRWEVYFGVEDIFVNLYSPKGNKDINQYSGKESDISNDANFNIGIPLPSVGFKVNF